MAGRPLHAAVHHVAHAQLAADGAHVDLGAAVAEGGAARDDEELLQAGQRVDDVVDDAVGKVGVVRVRLVLPERQHHDRRTALPADWRVAEGADPRVVHLEGEGPDGPRQVPQVQLAEVHEAHAGQADDLLGDGAGDHDATGLRIGLETRATLTPSP